MITQIVIAIIGSAVCASFFEWTLHRFVMHRPVRTLLGTFDYPFKAHAVVHHQVFKSDETYHLLGREDYKHTIPMAWWNAPVLIAIGLLPTVTFNLLFGHWWISLVCGAVFASYYGAYEYMHWCMHLPKKRNIERSGIYFRLNGHHLLHHRYMHKNFNVVLPLADLCFGTLLLRSKVNFKQAEGPSVPNVQPRQALPPRSRRHRRRLLWPFRWLIQLR